MASIILEASLDFTDETWADVDRYNQCLLRLCARRKSSVSAARELRFSKTAWKCAVYQQAILYRVTMLASGCADAWNNKNIISAMLSARALLETIVVGDFVRDALMALVNARDLDAADELLNDHLFATRDKATIARGSGREARSVLAFVDKFGKKLAGIRDHYEFMSEFCHPNGSGVFFTFGEIDRTTGNVSFSEVAPRVAGIQGHIITCYMLVQVAELIADDLESSISSIASLDRSGRWI